MNSTWAELHQNYRQQHWIDQPSLFAQTAIKYFPVNGIVLDLGAGQGQDSRFLATRGYEVVSTDFEPSALAENAAKRPKNSPQPFHIQTVDLRSPLPFEDASFDVVYAHLSLHYFDHTTTQQLFDEIHRVLRQGGTFAFLANSTSDPEYNSGRKLEEDYFAVNKLTKRYFSTRTASTFAHKFHIELLDDDGETYKDRAKGVHHLVRFIGRK